MTDERRFPVLFSRHDEEKALIAAGCPRTVPWSLLEPHEAAAQANHSQTLQRLAERGGLGVSEMVMVLTDTRWRGQRMNELESLPRLLAMLAPPTQEPKT